VLPGAGRFGFLGATFGAIVSAPALMLSYSHI